MLKLPTLKLHGRTIKKNSRFYEMEFIIFLRLLASSKLVFDSRVHSEFRVELNLRSKYILAIYSQILYLLALTPITSYFAKNYVRTAVGLCWTCLY
jgi:hypothetical protein